MQAAAASSMSVSLPGSAVLIRNKRSEKYGDEIMQNAKTKNKKTFRIHPRYARLFTDGRRELDERNYDYATLDWSIPLSMAAIVSVDVWNWHFTKETLERIEAITVKRIAPLFKACRQHGLQIIHAPAPPLAERSPNRVKLFPKSDQARPVWPNSPKWPPRDFQTRNGQYAAYARPIEPQEADRIRHRETLRDFHAAARPVADEAVIVSGEELHRLCARRGIMFLFYVGFSVNACIVGRTYGITEMNRRGYASILLRDCTTGMEIRTTRSELICTRGQIASLEQAGIYTLSATEVTRALSRPARPGMDKR